MIGCGNKGCCYAQGGGVSKCSKCDDEYKEFVSNPKRQKCSLGKELE